MSSPRIDAHAFQSRVQRAPLPLCIQKIMRLQFRVQVMRANLLHRMKGSLSWIINIGNELAHFVMGTIFLVNDKFDENPYP